MPVVSHLAPEVLAHAVAAVPNGLIIEHMPLELGRCSRSLPRIENSEIRPASKLQGWGLSSTRNRSIISRPSGL